MILTELLLKPKKPKKPKKKVLKEVHETSQQDFIISAFEAGEISKEEAWERIKKCTPKDLLYFWEIELFMADDLLNDPVNVHDSAISKKVH